MRKRNEDLNKTEPNDEVEEALKRSATKINPDPDFIERLSVRLRHAHRARRAPSAAPRRIPWLAWAGAAVAIILVVAGVGQLLQRSVPADAPPIETPLATVPTSAEGVTEAPASPTPLPTEVPAAIPTAVETEPPFVADLPPAVITTLPRDGEEVTLQAGILVRFTQPMDRASVEEALTVSPAVTGTFTWHDDRTVTFGTKALASATRYQVALSTEAQAANGLPLNRDMVFAFTTVGPLTITQTSPTDGVTGLRGDAPLLLTFNYPLVPINCTGQAAEEEGACAALPLEIVPATAGQGMWVNTSVYRFDPDPVWTAGTTYTVTVPSSISSPDGAVLNEPLSFAFTTAAPLVRSIKPTRYAKSVPLETDVRVTFNTPMDTASVEAAFQLESPQGDLVDGAFTWVDNDTTLVFTPTAMLATETTYEVRIDAAAHAKSGIPLKSGDQGTFTTVSPLGVILIGDSSGTTQSGRLDLYGSARVRFEGLIDPATTENAIHVTGSESGEEVEATIYWNLEDQQPTAWVNWDREPGDRYCITVGTELADRYGNRLAEPETACFVINGMPPTFAPVTEYNALTLDAAEAATIYFTAVNVPRAHMTLGTLETRDYLRYGDAARLQSIRRWEISTAGGANQAVLVPVQLNEGQPLPTGFYGLRWDAEGQQYPSQETLRIAVVDRHVLIKESASGALVWVTDLRSAEPVAGAAVRVINRNGNELGRGLTDADGIARVPISGRDSRWETITAIAGEPGQPGFGVARTDWNHDVVPWAFDIPYDYARPAAYRGTLQTDRPIYRPGQDVHLWGALRTDDDGHYALPDPGTEAEVELRGPDGAVLERIGLTLSNSGAFDTTYHLPEDARLGSYTLQLKVEGEERVLATLHFAVAAYRKPEFEVTVTPEQKDSLNGETIRALVEASYYAGGAVGSAQVRWTLWARPARFEPDIPGWWRWSTRSSWWHPWRDPEIIAEGEGTTDANGRLLVTLDGDLSPLGDEETVSAQRWTLEATVVDDAGFPVSQRGELTVHTGRFYIGLRPQSWVAVAGEAAAIDLRTLDWEGESMAEQSVTITLARRKWTYTPSPEPYSTGTWTHDDTPVETLSVETDLQGRSTVEVTPPTSGSYVVLAKGGDEEGNIVRSEAYLWVSGPQMAAWQLSEGKVEPVADAERYRPGDVAQILLPTPFEGPFEVLMTIERGSILEVERLTVREANPLIEIPITEDHVPNIVVAFAIVKGVDGRQSTPDVRIGMVNLEVEPTAQALDVTLEPRCPDEGLCTYGPGDTVEMTVRAVNARGNPVDADVVLSVVDKAVLALAEDNAPTLLESFYAPRPLGTITGDSLLTLHNRLAEDLEALRERAERIAREGLVGGIGGGGGGEAAYMPDVRQEFPDTALWEPELRTGPDGEVTVTFTLPDSLTTWVAEARVITAETHVGEARAEFVVTKPLLVRPVTPRFLVAGDRAEVAMVVHNNTDAELDVTPRLQTNLEVVDAADGAVVIPAHGRVRVTWTVAVPATGLEAADLTFSAAGGGFRDVTRPTVGRASDHALPIYRYESPDVVSTSGALTEAGSRVEVVIVPPEAGPDSTLTVRLEPTLAAGMLEGLDYLEGFPHACTEQLISRFLPNLATYRGLRELGQRDPELERKLEALVDEMLKALSKRQNADGGWGWWREQPSDLQLTAYAILGLVQAERAGFSVDAFTLSQGIRFLQRRLETGLKHEEGSLPFALAVYVLAEADQPWPVGVDQTLFESRDVMEVTGRAYLALALGLRDPDDPRVATLLDDLRADAVLTASGAHWESVASEHWVTWTRATSLALDALVRLAPDDPLLPQAIRWLMVARQGGRWETTQETAWAVMALTDYMIATGELDAAYEFGLAFNTEALESGAVTAETLRTPIEHTIPLDALLRDWPNALEVSRGTGPGTLYYTADLSLSLPVEALEPESRGITVERAYCRVDSLREQEDAPCEPVTSARPGELVEVRLTVIVPRQRNYVVLEDFYPAGMEPVDPTLQTEQQGTEPVTTSEGRRWWWRGFDHAELRDERGAFYASRLSAGTYEVRYYLRAAVPGDYKVMPATISEMYFPEVWGRTAGGAFRVLP
ncbi:MAG: Ig-like domain-containing protein [Anaerolineae bacterium]